MITFNNERWARNDKEMLDTLFDGKGTAVGFYQPKKTAVYLLNLQKERIGCINAYGVLCVATKQEDGRYWYSLAPFDKGYKKSPYIYQKDGYMAHTEKMREILIACDVKRKYSPKEPGALV